MKILVTGANGFVGRNLCVELSRRKDVELVRFDVDDSDSLLHAALAKADVIFHLAGVNRPKDLDDFRKGNAAFTEALCRKLIALGRAPKIVLSSSIQAEQANPYGASKRAAEESLRIYAQQTGAAAVVHRLKNLFGKWCRPNYNSVTATFCHNIANNVPIQISDREARVELTYIDDVVQAFLAELVDPREGFRFTDALPSHNVVLGELADLIVSFRQSRSSLLLPDFSKPFVRALYATFLSYLPTDSFGYGLDIKTDPRGCLAEFVKQPAFGQVFVSRTKPGITRGNHFHDTKVEKFLVVEGRAVIRFRAVNNAKVLEYRCEVRNFGS